MNDLRKAAEMALEALQDTCDHLPSRSGVEREVDDAITALQVALVHSEQEAFTLDRGCYERGCVAFDERDGDGVIVYVDPVLKEKNA